MRQHPWKCEGCGAAVASTESDCPFCEAEEKKDRDHEAMEWLGEICWNMTVRERLTGGVDVAVLPVEGLCVRGDGEALTDAILDAKAKWEEA